jgi:hypothetical protein
MKGLHGKSCFGTLRGAVTAVGVTWQVTLLNDTHKQRVALE